MPVANENISQSRLRGQIIGARIAKVLITGGLVGGWISLLDWIGSLL